VFSLSFVLRQCYKCPACGSPGFLAPFEVSERSSVYQNHKDWLVRNAQGSPIHAGHVSTDSKKKLDQLYVLDATNKEAQDYLRWTYATLTREWSVRFIKLDFMEDRAVEGHYSRPSTTAMEAQRIGLHVIRQAVGDEVLLDKDGSAMLNSVGLVDMGRISVDTGHTFEAYKEAAPGIAARYYMNRNFFVSDPDAFSVSRQAVLDEDWHGGKRPLTLDEARVAIALSAVSGGMFEIGDDLPTLFLDADRVALVENRDLINMAKYGHASKPLDLMTYSAEDEMPSVYLLRESKRQSVLTVFNWTDSVRQRPVSLSGLGLGPGGHSQVLDVFDPKRPVPETVVGTNQDSISLDLAPRSVRMLKIIDTSVPAAAPSVVVHAQDRAQTGMAAQFSAVANAEGIPAVSYSWDFGDGTSGSGASTNHTFTHEGTFNVRLRTDGIEGVPFETTLPVMVSGSIKTRFDPGTF
jgi:alpha-galactosidase